MAATFKRIFTLFYSHKLDIVFMYLSFSLILLHKITHFNLNVLNFSAVILANVLGVIGIYIINTVSDRKEDLLNAIPVLPYSTKSLYLITLLFFGAAGLLYLIPQKITLIPIGIFLTILGILYSFPRQYRLKNIFIVKNILPAFCWYLSFATIIIASTETLSLITILKILLPSFFLVLIFEIIWDIPDEQGDKVSNIKTLPTVLGQKITKGILIGILSFFFLITDSLQNKIACIVFILFIINVKEEAPKFTYHLFLTILTIAVVVTYVFTH